MIQEKTQIAVGNILWLRRLASDTPTPSRRYHTDSDDSDYSDPTSDRLFKELEDEYEALGLERGCCDHPCIVIDLLDGWHADDSKVSVCVMTSFGGQNLIDHIKNPGLWPLYLAIAPTAPTYHHPDVQLKLEQDRAMPRSGYVNHTPKNVPIRLLETCRSGRYFPHEIGFLQLDEESINTLREKSGYSLLCDPTDSDSSTSNGSEASGPTHPVAIDKTASIHENTQQSCSEGENECASEGGSEGETPSCEADQAGGGGSECETSCSEDDNAMSVRNSFSPWRILSDLAKFMHGST